MPVILKQTQRFGPVRFVRLEEFTNRLITERREQLRQGIAPTAAKKRVAFLDLLLTAQDEQGESLSDDAIREEVDSTFYDNRPWNGVWVGRWRGARWMGARWRGARRRGARWRGARWRGARWRGAQWMGERGGGERGGGERGGGGSTGGERGGGVRDTL